jgi:nucleoid DNA-binding protein
MKRMMIGRGELLRAMLKRMPYVKFYDMMFFVNAIIELMIKRILEDKIIIVDGFGVFNRMKTKPRKAVNIGTKEYQTIVGHYIAFRPHYAFMQMVKWTGEDFLKEIILKKSAKEIASRKRRKRLI